MLGICTGYVVHVLHLQDAESVPDPVPERQTMFVILFLDAIC